MTTHCGFCCEPGHTMAECEHPIKDTLATSRLDFQQVDDHRVRVQLVPREGPGEIEELTRLQDERNDDLAQGILSQANLAARSRGGDLTLDDIVAVAAGARSLFR